MIVVQNKADIALVRAEEEIKGHARDVSIIMIKDLQFRVVRSKKMKKGQTGTIEELSEIRGWKPSDDRMITFEIPQNLLTAYARQLEAQRHIPLYRRLVAAVFGMLASMRREIG